MKYLLILAALVLTGCASTGFNNTEVLVTKEYVVRTAPDVLKALPPLPPGLANPATATNSQIATFISNSEEYIANLESMIAILVNFYEKPVTTNEAAQLKGAPTTTPAAAVTTASGAAQPASAATFSSPLQRARAGK